MTKVFVKTFLVLAAASLGLSGVARATSIQASLFTPLVPDGTTIVPVTIQGVPSTPSQSPIMGNGFNVMFNVAPPPANRASGVVQGSISGLQGVPVAGVANGGPLYLTGDFGSPLTPNIGMSGKYFSTGASGAGDGGGNPMVPNAQITINFTNPETSLALLWGSIDRGNGQNILTFMNGTTVVGTVTGAEAQAAANSLPDGLGNGFLGVGGSAYFVIDTDAPFTSVTASNMQVSPGNRPSFEFTGVAAGSGFIPNVPEPASFWTLTMGFGMIAALVVGRRRQGRSAR